MVQQEGRRCIMVSGDIGNPSTCHTIVLEAKAAFGRIDIVVNNAAEQHQRKDIRDISSEQLERVFRTNIFSMFYLTQVTGRDAIRSIYM